MTPNINLALSLRPAYVSSPAWILEVDFINLFAKTTKKYKPRARADTKKQHLPTRCEAGYNPPIPQKTTTIKNRVHMYQSHKKIRRKNPHKKEHAQVKRVSACVYVARVDFASKTLCRRRHTQETTNTFAKKSTTLPSGQQQ